MLDTFRAVEDGLGGSGVAAVAVVGIEGAGDGQELFDKPAVDGKGAAGHGDIARVIALGQLLGVLRHFVKGARRLLGIEAGGLEHVLVVIQQRRRGVERHGVLLAVDGVVGQHVRFEVGRVEVLGVHEVLDRLGYLQVHHQLGRNVKELDQGRDVVALQAGAQLVERVVVAALVGRLDKAVGLAGVEVVGQLGDRDTAHVAAHAVPEGDAGGAGRSLHCGCFTGRLFGRGTGRRAGCAPAGRGLPALPAVRRRHPPAC